MANLLPISRTNHVLDVGSGVGGPARYMARRFGCRVSGIDLTGEFCDVARHLTALLGLAERVSFEQGDALAMPFGDAVFDCAYSMNVSMNIADKRALYREIHRMLRPGAWLGLSEVVQGPGGEPDYPTPWARTASLGSSGSRYDVGRDPGEPRHAIRRRTLAVSWIHGALAEEIAANVGRASRERRAVGIEVVCRKARP